MTIKKDPNIISLLKSYGITEEDLNKGSSFQFLVKKMAIIGFVEGIKVLADSIKMIAMASISSLDSKSIKIYLAGIDSYRILIEKLLMTESEDSFSFLPKTEENFSAVEKEDTKFHDPEDEFSKAYKELLNAKKNNSGSGNSN